MFFACLNVGTIGRSLDAISAAAILFLVCPLPLAFHVIMVTIVHVGLSMGLGLVSRLHSMQSQCNNSMNSAFVEIRSFMTSAPSLRLDQL